jgi:hypothetical protein
LQGDAQWTFFPCDQWLSTSQGDGRISRVLLPGAASQRRSYAITTATSDLRGAGSSANVWVVLHGSLATSGRHVLSGGQSDFERGAVNQFQVEDKELGQLLQVRLLLAAGAQGGLLDECCPAAKVAEGSRHHAPTHQHVGCQAKHAQAHRPCSRRAARAGDGGP